MTKHLLKQALEALKRYQHGEYRNCGELIGEIEAELARPEPEPIGFFTGKFNGGIGGNICIEVKCNGPIPTAGAKLYIEPPTRKPLSDDQIDAILFMASPSSMTRSLRDFARRVEKAHGIEP